MTPDLTRCSRFLSYVLRHRPDELGLTLDAAGWVEVDALVAATQRSAHPMTRAIVLEIVRGDAKQRYGLSEDGRRIRASQGHSVEVDLELAPRTPPAALYHGTAARFLPSIRERGLVRGARHHVHLSGDEQTARAVGSRHGKAVVLTVDAQGMHAAGYRFQRSDNGVWLVDEVPVTFLCLPDDA